MDLLIQSVKNFTEQEFQQFLKTLRGQPKKRDLLKAIYHSKSEQVNLEKIAETLGYKSSKIAFFTLKHRLTKDLIEYRLHDRENEIVSTENRIHELRVLLYSKDHKLLEKEIKELKKKAEELEIIRGQYEIHFCEYLINYHNSSKRKQIHERMEQVLEREKIFNLSELEFFRVIFEYQDLYYLSFIQMPSLYQDDSLQRLEFYHRKLNTNVSEFFYLSALLTFELRLNQDRESLKRLNQTIVRLEEIYRTKQLKQRFPNCDFAIRCLFNKYYLAIGDYSEFEATLMQLEKDARKIAGYKPYEDVLFYYLYVSLYHAYARQQIESFINEANELVGKDLTKQYSERFQYYFNHLLGMAYYFSKNYRKAESYLLRSRNHEKFLEPSNFWIQIENHLLNLSIQVRNRSDETALFELNQLKKLAIKYPYLNPLMKDFLKFALKHISSNIRVFFDFEEQLKLLCEKTGFFYLYFFDFRDTKTKQIH